MIEALSEQIEALQNREGIIGDEINRIVAETSMLRFARDARP